MIPTYLRPADLRRCLEGLLAQTRRPAQVVVVVRDTDAESRRVAESYRDAASGGTDIEIVPVSRPGMLSALNAGLPSMKGDVLCFTDDDAEPLPDWLERIEQWYEDPTVVGVGGRDLMVRDPATLNERCQVVGHCSWYGRVLGNHHLALDPPKPVEVCVLKGVNMSYRRTALAGFRFDERMAAYSSTWNELDAGFFVRRDGGRLVYDPEIRVRHHVSPRSEFGRGDPIRFYDYSHNYTYVMLKHLSWPRRLVFLAYFFLVGQQASWAPVVVGYQIVRRRRLIPWIEVKHSLAGKLSGVRSFLGWWRETRAGSRTA
jgi:glycosyltransferase involved in cell wall biosynthesis